MTAVIFHVLAWPTFGIAVLVFGFAPGAALRLIVLFYRRDNPRRRELIGELYAVPRIERPFWVAEQLEIALSKACAVVPQRAAQESCLPSLAYSRFAEQAPRSNFVEICTQAYWLRAFKKIEATEYCSSWTRMASPIR